jgi:hypothetical protein
MKLRSLVGVAALVAAGVVIPGPGPSSTPVAQAAGELGAGGEFHALPPTRIFDSRPESTLNDVAPVGIKPTGPSTPTFDVQMLGLGGVPSDASEVLGVVVSVAINGQSVNGNLRAYPSGGTATTTAVLAYGVGPAVSNLAIVRPGANGKVTFALNSGAAGAAHVAIDVFGFLSTSNFATRGGRVVTRTPSRLLDTRNGTGVAAPGPVAGGSLIRLPIRGADGVEPTVVDAIPNDANVVGVILNIAAVNNLPGSQGTFISALPDDPSSTPSTANVNVGQGRTKSNTIMVPVGADGAIRLYNRNGSAHIVADAIGYVLANQNVDTRAGRVVPLSSPYRALDTREAIHGAVKLGPKQQEDWSFVAFSGSVNIDGAAAGNQAGLIGNMTTAALSRQFSGTPVSEYVTMWPSDAPGRPLAATVNNSEANAVSNMAIGTYGAGGTMRVYNDQGSVHYILDVLAVVLAD